MNCSFSETHLKYTSPFPHCPFTVCTDIHIHTLISLQSLGEELVHLGHLVGDRQVNRAVGNLDDKSTTDLWVDLGHNLERLAASYVFRILDGSLKAADCPVVKGLLSLSVIISH